MPIIKTVQLVKKFHDLVAVDHVNLEIDEQECFGLLGPNGAGKTSLIRMITAVSPPTSGDIRVDGMDLAVSPRQIKARLGVVPQNDNLDPDLTVLQNLLVFARYFDIPRQEAYRRSMDVLKLFQLEAKLDSQIRELSGGMKRRLLIARGLINEPKILILDEPTIGLDPQAKHLVWQKLQQLRKQGITELLCTQNMDEAELLCDRVAIMHLGKVLDINQPQRLIKQYIGDQAWGIETPLEQRDRLIADLQKLNIDYTESGRTVKIFRLPDGLSDKYTVRTIVPTLEDVFFKLTGRSLIE